MAALLACVLTLQLRRLIICLQDDEQEAFIPTGKGARKRKGTLTAEEFEDDDDSDGGQAGGGR